MTPPPADSGAGDTSIDLVVVGGGAAGFFGAVSCAEARPGSRIVVLEKSRDVLGKVKISGGGRCNVTHACFDPRELTTFYPRGSKQLIGPFHRWSPADTMSWFEDHGVELKTEDDGRVFPVSDCSQSIIDCLIRAAHDAGVMVRTSTAAERVTARDDRDFQIDLDGGETLRARHFLLTTGGTRTPIGARIAESLGHQTEPAAPSLFTFKIEDPRIGGLQGLSVPSATVTVTPPGNSPCLEATGPVLITHWGLSGPGILRVSAWGARELHACDYRFEVVINWCGRRDEAEIAASFEQFRTESPRKSIVNDPQFSIPARLWKSLVKATLADTNADPSLRWAHLPRDLAARLASQLGACRFAVEGKSMNKEEFVTCGGVRLDEVNFKTMESRLTPGLHFAGEVLDIDGITGGFNFQSAWTTGRIAGEAIADTIED